MLEPRVNIASEITKKRTESEGKKFISFYEHFII